MGIDCDKYLTLNGLATINKCYIRVKDFKNTKAHGVHTFEYAVEILVNNVILTKEFKSTSPSNVPITEDNWKFAYNHVKAELTKQGITFTDKI